MNRIENSTISIVMINYNGINYLKRTIPVLFELNYKNKEIIIVDNGSTDGSIDFIKSFENIKLIQSPRLREKNYACNLGVKNASGEYIFLCDNDLLITELSLLDNLKKLYEKQKNTGIIGISFVNEGELKTKGYGNYLGYYYTKEKKSVNTNELLNYNLNEISFPSGIGFFIKKDLWNNIGGFDDFLKFGGDDSDIGIKSWLFGYKNYLYTKSVQIHIGMPERKDNNKFNIKFKEMFFADMYTITKNFGKLNMFITILMYSFYYFLRSIKQSIFRFNIGPFLAFFKGYILYIKNIKYNLKKRKEIQDKRIIKKDIFLNIKIPY
ncbi:MAG: glycosyltransferase [Candidatus Gracilibacteria bacterium]|nr:glycosyltransferase [Candidatus Gracilibacteria bacterium]